MAVINKPAQPLIAPTDVEEVEAIAGAAAADAIAADTTHAPLVNDLVPAAHLPSYVDDVLEFETLDAFPEEGEEGKIYVARDTNNTYRWADTTYVQVGGSESSSAVQHYLFLNAIINKPSGPGPIVVGSELQVIDFRCDNCDLNVWFPYDIGTAPVVTHIDLGIPAESSNNDELPDIIVGTGFTALFYPRSEIFNPQDVSNTLYDIAGERQIAYNSETGKISLNLATSIYRYCDESGQLIYGAGDILVTPYQETDANAHFAAIEHLSSISPILDKQFGIAPSVLIYNGIAYTHVGCERYPLSQFDHDAGVLDLITGESIASNGLKPACYLESNEEGYWIQPSGVQLDLDNSDWSADVTDEGLEYCYRVRNINDEFYIDFVYQPTSDINLSLMFNIDTDSFSEHNYPIIHQLTFGRRVSCTALLQADSLRPLSRDVGQIIANLFSSGTGYELEWKFYGTNGIIIGSYWMDMETGDLMHEIIWDNYKVPTAEGGDPVYIPVRYHKRPTPESEWNPPSEWPTELSLDEIHQGTVNFSDLISEDPDGYDWQIINVGGYCTCNDDGRTVIDAWGPIDVNVYHVTKPR